MPSSIPPFIYLLTYILICVCVQQGHMYYCCCSAPDITHTHTVCGSSRGSSTTRIRANSIKALLNKTKNTKLNRESEFARNLCVGREIVLFASFLVVFVFFLFSIVLINCEKNIFGFIFFIFTVLNIHIVKTGIVGAQLVFVC